jgi:hypothetical protein
MMRLFSRKWSAHHSPFFTRSMQISGFLSASVSSAENCAERVIDKKTDGGGFLRSVRGGGNGARSPLTTRPLVGEMRKLNDGHARQGLIAT